MSRKRAIETPEAAVARELEYVRAFGRRVERLALAEADARLWRDIEKVYVGLRETAADRGERWSATYQAKRARQRAERDEAVAAALRAL